MTRRQKAVLAILTSIVIALAIGFGGWFAMLAITGPVD